VRADHLYFEQREAETRTLLWPLHSWVSLTCWDLNWPAPEIRKKN